MVTRKPEKRNPIAKALRLLKPKVKPSKKVYKRIRLKSARDE
jgi:hypothetical protein